MICREFHPTFACHDLLVDIKAKWVAGHHQTQLLEKVEAAAKVVEDLINAEFVKEVKFTTLILNVVLLEKSNEKWHMCVDYIDLNKAYPRTPSPFSISTNW